MSNTASKKTTSAKPAGYSLDKYFDQIAKMNERVAESLSEARARNDRILDQVIDSTIAGQQDLLSLGRSLAAAPTDYTKNLQLIMDVMTRSQERALELGKTLYREQSEAGSAVTEGVNDFYGSLNLGEADWRAPYRKMAELWGFKAA